MSRSFAGYEDGASLSRELRRTLETVERYYAGLFEDAPKLTSSGSNMVFAGATDDPATIEELKRLGYSQPSHVLARSCAAGITAERRRCARRAPASA